MSAFSKPPRRAPGGQPLLEHRPDSMAGGAHWGLLDAWLTPGRFAAVLGLLIAAVYSDVLFGGQSFFYRDFGLFGYPLAFYHRESFWRGEVPLWNPYSNCGLPFLAQWNTMVLYPGSLVYLLLPLPWSLNLFCLAHLFLAGIGMYSLALAWTRLRLAGWVAGLAYAFNGLTLHSLMWPNNMAALGWMPWVILSLERARTQGGRWIYMSALVGAAQMLAGAPEIIFFTWLVSLFFLTADLGRATPSEPFSWSRIARGSRRVLAVASLVLGLAAVQLLPFFRLLGYSHRDSQFADAVWSMPGWGWANLLVPLFRCTPSLAGVYSQDDQQWTSSYYLGIGVLAWAVLGMGSALKPGANRVWRLGAVALLGLVLALGDNSPVYGWVKSVLPLIGVVRFPIKSVVLTVWAVPLLAAFGLRAFLVSDRIGRWEARTRCGTVGGVFAVLIGLLLYFAARYPAIDERWQSTMLSGLSRAGFLGGILVCGLAIAQARSLGRASAWAFGLLGLIAGDALSHAPCQNPTVVARALTERPDSDKHGTELGDGRAMLSPRVRAVLAQAGHPDPLEYTRGHRRILYPNWNLVQGVRMPDGFFSLYLKEQRQVWEVLYGDASKYPASLADFLGASLISSDTDLFSWEPRPAALPFVSGGQSPVFLEEAPTLDRFRRGDFRPAREVLLPASVEPFLPVKQSAEVRIGRVQAEAHTVMAEVEAGSEALVVVGQTWSPDWQASVNGRRVRLWRANHAFQAVVVPPGRSEVKLTYQDRMYQLGALISAMCLGGVGVGFFSKRNRQPERAPDGWATWS